MARTVLGSLLDRNFRNELNRMLTELYGNLNTATATKNRLDDFLTGTGVVTRKMLAGSSVGYSQLDEEITHLILEFRDDYSNAMTTENEEWVV